ncbi:unnamed protein product [Knipowitschia caucasica]
MEDEEDDVFEPDLPCWQSSFREIKCEDRATQTPGPVLALNKGMLPFGVAQEPRPLFYGNAGFRLHFPAHFELSEAQEASGSLPEREMQNGRDLLPRQPLAAHSMEACIGHRLQVIGDQFHRDHLQRYYQNHLHQRPVWWRLATALLSLLFGRGGRGAVGQR